MRSFNTKALYALADATGITLEISRGKTPSIRGATFRHVALGGLSLQNKLAIVSSLSTPDGAIILCTGLGDIVIVFEAIGEDVCLFVCDRTKFSEPPFLFFENWEPVDRAESALDAIVHTVVASYQRRGVEWAPMRNAQDKGTHDTDHMDGG